MQSNLKKVGVLKKSTGTPIGKRPLGRSSNWEDNIRIHLNEIGSNTMDWI